MDHKDWTRKYCCGDSVLLWKFHLSEVFTLEGTGVVAPVAGLEDSPASVACSFFVTGGTEGGGPAAGLFSCAGGSSWNFQVNFHLQGEYILEWNRTKSFT